MRNKNWPQKTAVYVLSVAFLAGCATGPDYKAPTMEAELAFKQAPPGSWKIAEPADALPRGPWWQAFDDPVLNGLAERAIAANQDIVAAEARVRQSQALLQQARSSLFPNVGAGLNTTRAERGGQNTTNLQLGLNANWEIDLWGRVRNTVAAQKATYQATVADTEAARLSILAQLASTYFDLRVADAQKETYERNVAAAQRSLEVTQNRFRAGVIDRADVAQAEMQLKSVQTQLIDVGVTRAQLEHALAVLVGQVPANFSLATAPLNAKLPAVPTGLASTLLERRPDIASAERQVAAANADIGAARAAYFPALTLSASGGFAGAGVAGWLTGPNQFWSIGAALAQTLFDAGARRARTAQAQAAYEGQLATYRQTVLSAFREVEDNLAALRILEEEARLQDETLAAARQALALASNQYRAGVVGLINVLTAQTAVLSNERAVVSLQGRRLAATVQLIRALGGGWDRSALPQ